jgi:ribosomal 50S subunit-recycling heat shock protein
MKSNAVKEGRIFKLRQLEKFQLEGGIVNINRMNSCYLKVSTHIEIDKETSVKVVNHLFRKIHSLLTPKKDDDVLKSKFISTQEIPGSFLETKKAYMCMEFNYFLQPELTTRTVIRKLNEMCSKLDQATEEHELINFKRKKKINYAKK